MTRLLRLLFVLSIATVAPAFAQTKPEAIEALVAPIALYPDAVLSQALMASTYPLEVVQAAQWLKANPKVKGDAAVKAVANQKWDVSVKSLVGLPQVLEPMSENIDWTQKLGDAFLADERSVMDAVQRLRQRAYQAGNLKSSEQQKVVVEQNVIKVEPANPQVVYVPAYNPTVVYGPWMYPAYPPYYWPMHAHYYPGSYVGAGLSFGIGVATVGVVFGGFNWGRNEVDIDVNKAVTVDRSFNRENVGSRGEWQHDASHRGGVAYRDAATRERYARDVPGAEARQDFRGREGASGGGERLAAADTARASGAFEGVGSGAAAQRDFDRGQASAAAASRAEGARSAAAAGAGAGARAGGGGFSGGGGRGGGGGFGGGGFGGGGGRR